MEAFDGRVFNCSVHAFDLTIGPWVVWLGQAMLDSIGVTDHVKAHLPGISGVSVPGLVGELDAVIGQPGVDAERHVLQQMFEELPRCASVNLVDELGNRKFARVVDADKQVSLPSAVCTSAISMWKKQIG